MLGLSKSRKAIYKKNLQAAIDFRTKSGKFLRMPPELKEKLRLEFDEIRDQYELANLGSFEQILPTKNAENQEKYARLLSLS